MGRQAYPIIGGIIGAAVAFIATDGTASWQGYQAGFAIGAAIGGVAGSYIDPILIQGNKIGEAPIQVAAEGGARAITFGRACISATCVMARGNRKIVKKKQSNGKGSSGSTQNETVTWTFAIGLGEAIENGLLTRVWQDENLVFDITTGHTISDEDNTKFSQKFRFYEGNEEQLPDPDLQVFLGDQTPYFRGTMYVVFPNFDLTNTNERIPTFRFEVLNGIAGLVKKLETLHWDYPTTGFPGNTLQPQSHSVTLTGDPSLTYTVDMYLTAAMELRNYDHVTAVVGGDGHFVTATDDHASTIPLANIYRVSIDHPPQVFYVNRLKPGEDPLDRFIADGSATYKLSMTIAGNATIEFFADPKDGAGGFAPQFGTVRVEISGTIDANIKMPLGDIVSTLLDRTGLPAENYDVSQLTNMVSGVCIQSSLSGVEAVQSCVQPFFADPAEIDDVLTFVKRGQDVVRTLTLEDLTEEPDSGSRENVIEYPAKVHFFYQSPVTGYAATKATSYRSSPQVDSSSEGSVTSPITFADSVEPANIAAKLHKVMWNEAEGAFLWKVAYNNIDLVPTDVVGLFLRGIVARARVIGVENDGQTLSLTLIKDRQSAYTANVSAIPLPLPTPPDPTTMSKSVLAVMDIPALLDSDDDLNYYTAISGETETWNGAELQRSLDGGSTWVAIGQFTTDVTMGRLTAPMTAVDRRYSDLDNVVSVQLFDDRNELHSYTDLQFHQEQGAIAVQLTDGTYEILQYRDAVDNGNGSYDLSTLQRGRKNTVAGAHDVGALFVFLESYISKNPAQAAWLGGDLRLRAVSYGTSSEDADVVDITYAGRSQQAWSPASAEVSFSAGTLTIANLVARSRFGTEVNPVASTHDVGFRVTMTDGATTVTQDIIAVDTTLPTAPLTTVTTVSIAALNDYTGPGAPLVITL